MGLNGVQIKTTDILVVDRLKRFLRKGLFNCINEGVLSKEFQKRLLYPTNDFHLTKEQFDAVKCLLRPNENLYLFQMGFDGGFFSLKNSYYQMNRNLEYHDYSEIWIDSISVLSSDAWEWIVLIDEAADGGLGVFVASEEIIRRFSQIHADLATDIIRFVDFFVCNSRSSQEMYGYMMEILHMCE